jgi:hypothetical protein
MGATASVSLAPNATTHSQDQVRPLLRALGALYDGVMAQGLGQACLRGLHAGRSRVPSADADVVFGWEFESPAKQSKARADVAIAVGPGQSNGVLRIVVEK